MSTRISLGAGAKDGRQQVLWKDRERVLYRELRADRTRTSHSILTLRLIAKSPPPASLNGLAHEYGLKDHLESAWAARPLELLRDRDGTMLVLEDPGGETLDRRVAEPMEVPQFLPLAVALGRMHQRGLVHKDLKPAHILVNESNGQVRLTGFGRASRLPRERQLPVPTGSIAHEFSQPIAATVIGAKAALGWLEHQPPDLERVRRSLDRIIKNGERAREVFGRTL